MAAGRGALERSRRGAARPRDRRAERHLDSSSSGRCCRRSPPRGRRGDRARRLRHPVLQRADQRRAAQRRGRARRALRPLFIDYLRKHPDASGARAARHERAVPARAWSEAAGRGQLRSLELFGMRFGLDRMRRMMTALGSPERSLRDDPGARHQRQVLDHADDRGDPRAPRAAHRRLHLAAPGRLPRTRADRRARARRRRLRARDRARRAARPSRSTARSPRTTT